jgi:hypothetical protein
MNAEGLLPVSTDTLLDLITHLRNTGSALTLADAAAEAIRAWLGASASASASASAGEGSVSDANRGALTNRGPLTSRANIADRINLAAWTSRANRINRGNGSKRADRADHHGLPCRTYRSNRTVQSDGAGALAAEIPTAAGYQWKELFLPDGTDLRMSFENEVYHARVTGDAIVYQGRRVSPRQLTIAIAGDGRNAWRDLLLRLPGEKNWRPASLLRRNVQASIQAKPGGEVQASPTALIAAAASSMSQALRTALELVEHSNAQSVQKYERRVASYRRADDVLGEHAQFD